MDWEAEGLLEGLDGVNKMGKSLGNYVGINEPANDIFGKTMSISDALMWRWYTLLSFRSEAEIAGLRKEVEGGRNPRDAKVMLAKEITARFHSAQAADAAEQDFTNRSKGGVPDDIPEVQLSGAPLGLLARVTWTVRGRMVTVLLALSPLESVTVRMTS